MSDFWEKFVLIALDKLLLGAAAAVMTFFVSRAVERYRRDQAVVAELGKQRALALIRIVSVLVRCQNAVERAYRNPPQSDDLLVGDPMATIHPVISEASRALDESTYLLGSLAGPVSTYIDLINQSFECLERRQARPPALEAALRETRSVLDRHLPPVHLPD